MEPHKKKTIEKKNLVSVLIKKNEKMFCKLTCKIERILIVERKNLRVIKNRK